MIEKARFRKLVIPGDQLLIEVRKSMQEDQSGKFDCCAKVNEEIVADASITAMIVD